MAALALQRHPLGDDQILDVGARRRADDVAGVGGVDRLLDGAEGVVVGAGRAGGPLHDEEVGRPGRPGARADAPTWSLFERTLASKALTHALAETLARQANLVKGRLRKFQLLLQCLQLIQLVGDRGQLVTRQTARAASARGHCPAQSGTSAARHTAGGGLLQQLFNLLRA